MQNARRIKALRDAKDAKKDSSEDPTKPEQATKVKEVDSKDLSVQLRMARKQ